MTDLTLYQIDAFAETVFTGNPAAVIVHDQFLSDAVMQNIAMENNLSETAFVVPQPETPGHYDLRWFTPLSEIEFCGHATLASAHVLLLELGHPGPLTFHTQIGELEVTEQDKRLCLKAPKPEITPTVVTDEIIKAFPVTILEAFWSSKNLFLVFESADDIRSISPDREKVTTLSDYGVGITARTTETDTGYDCISRFFVPSEGIDEDPVTGSAHTSIGAYWARVLGKPRLSAYQASRRGGQMDIVVGDTVVRIAGHTLTYMVGTVSLPDDMITPAS